MRRRRTMTEEIEFSEHAEGRTFNFTGPVETFDEETKNVYYRLRRVALLAGDEGKLPDGKVYTEAQVIEILGEDYAAGLVNDKKCCG
jgi:hypothetical protein